MALYEEFSITQGTDVTVDMYLCNIDGTAKNLAGYSVASQIRATVNTPDSAAITFDSVVSDPASEGIVTLMLSNTQTNTLTRPRYLFDVEISFQDSDGNTIIERVLEGIINVEPKITRG